MRRGMWLAATAYLMWGALPLYWHALDRVPAMQVVGHRLVWSFVLLLAALAVTGRWRSLKTCLTAKTVAVSAIAAVFMTVNWTIYIWAIGAGRVVESSLGYFINPLIVVILGVVVLRERLRRGQWVAVALAAVGMIYITWSYGSVPWVAISLAGTWSVYQLIKKLAPLGSVEGLIVESGLMLIPAVGFLVFAARSGTGAFLASTPMTSVLLAGAGVATAVPLLFYASATRRMPLSWAGVLQYIQPSITFLIGVVIFHEALSPQRLAGFLIIWAALGVFAVDGVMSQRQATTIVPIDASLAAAGIGDAE